MPAYKLVVVLPFLKYRRGDVIRDQSVVNAILDPSNFEMYQLKKNVRRVSCALSEIEEKPQFNEPAVPPEENLEVQISTVSGLEEESALLKNKRLSKTSKGD